ncbi:MAG: hypothetical protein ACLU9S_21470 [Oscillospiraceae bacterium]
MQGGLIDWFRQKFGKKKQPMNISSPISAQVDTSPEALALPEGHARRDDGRLAGPEPHGSGLARTARRCSLPSGADGRVCKRFRHSESNDSFARGDRSGALVKLQLRKHFLGRGDKASKAYRGGLLDSYSQNVADYFHNLEGGGMDMRYALNNTQKGTIAGSPGSFVTGGRIDQNRG